MGTFGRERDDTFEAELIAFEGEPSSAAAAAALEYVGIAFSGEWIRARVRGVQRRLEGGRPWPTSFPDGAAIIAHLERLSLQVRGPGSEREAAGTERARWDRYEECVRDSVRRWLPDGAESAYRWRVTRADPGRQKGSAVCSEPVRIVLADHLGGGSLANGIGVATRMAREGVDGGVRRLRHLVLAQGLRLDLDAAKRTCHRLLLRADIGPRVAGLMADAVNESMLVGRRLVPLDVVAFDHDYVDAFLEALAAALTPDELA